MSKTTTIAKIRADGVPVEITPDGAEVPIADVPLAPMTDEEVHVAAMNDPDARPMTDEEWKAARKVPRTKTLRRALGLTQEEFSARFYIPLGTLRDWEQGKSEPDQSTRAYLRAIAGDAAAVQRALKAGPEPR
jgi:putative transcriptional regulator